MKAMTYVSPEDRIIELARELKQAIHDLQDMDGSQERGEQIIEEICKQVGLLDDEDNQSGPLN